MKNSNHEPSSDPRHRSRRWFSRFVLGRRWLSRIVLAAIFLVALAGFVVATIVLARPARPRTHQVHMVTDLVPLRKALAEQIRAEGSRHHLDVILTAKHYGALEGLKEVDSPNEIKLALIP